MSEFLDESAVQVAVYGQGSWVRSRSCRRRPSAADTTALPLTTRLTRPGVTVRIGRLVDGSLEPTAEPIARSTLCEW